VLGFEVPLSLEQERAPDVPTDSATRPCYLRHRLGATVRRVRMQRVQEDVLIHSTLMTVLDLNDAWNEAWSWPSRSPARRICASTT
jgi:hypothetical protein